MPSNTKSNAARIPCGKCGGYVGEKLLLLPGEILQTAGRAEPQNLYQLKMYRDGLVLQGCQPTHGTLLVQNYSSDLKLMLDQMNRLPPPAASRGTDGTPRMHPGLCAGRSGRCAPRRGWDSDKKNSEKGLQSCANRVSLQVRQCPPEVFQRGITVPSQKTALGPPITTVLETALYLHNSKWGAVLFFHGFCLRNSSIGGG